MKCCEYGRYYESERNVQNDLFIDDFNFLHLKFFLRNFVNTDLEEKGTNNIGRFIFKLEKFQKLYLVTFFIYKLHLLWWINAIA